MPSYSRSKSTETVLSNSQSPSFVIFRRSSETSEKSNEEHEIMNKLTTRRVQKRPKPVSPISPKKAIHPAPKKIKEETEIQATTESVTGDYCFQIKENEKRMRAITGLHIDILEMYTTLSASASLIPCPHTLLLDDTAIEDRKRVLLKVFSRRYSLKVSSETLHLGAALLDMCLDVMTVNTDTLRDLAGVVVVIASKVEDVNFLSLGNIIDIKLIENNSLKMISSLERFVLVSLSFNVTIPTPLNFATYMLVHLCATQSKRNLTHYFLELSILYVHNRTYASDVVAYAATCLAFAMETEPDQIVSRVLRETELGLRVFTDKNYLTKRKQSQEVMRTLIDLFDVASLEDHEIFKEYSTSRRDNVALRRIDPDLFEILRIDSI